MKILINILAHHKPWLIETSLISLLSQDDLNFDLNIIYIQGNGKNNNKELKKYNKIFENTKKKNIQLTDADPKILDVLKNLKLKHNIYYYDNNHGLDSGAWIKFLESKNWINYDYCFFLMEGFIFTSQSTISDFKIFGNENNPDFIGTGFEKRYYPVDKFIKSFKKNNDAMDILHTQSINEIFKIFSKDPDFANILNEYKLFSIKNHNGFTQYHMPNKHINNIKKIILNLKYLFIKKTIPSFTDNKILISDENNNKYLNSIENLSLQFKNYGSTIFHLDNSFVFSCMCQHVFSKKFLTNLFEFYNKNQLFNVINKPFSATPLEVIWGLYPLIFNVDKWFFNGIYRPRKDFFTYNRIDEKSKKLSSIFNLFNNDIKTSSVNDSVKINYFDKKFKSNFKFLGDYFFNDKFKK